MSALEEVPEEVEVPEVPEAVPEEVPEGVPEVPPEPPKRGRGRPRKDPTAPPKPKKQPLVAREEVQEAPREERLSDVDRILYLFKEREIEEQRRKSEQYRVMLGL